MDFGIAGRTAVVRGKGEVADACRHALAHEGVRLAAEPGPDIDIVVSSPPVPLGPGLLDVGSEDELLSAWSTAVDSVAVYREALPSMSARGWGRLVWVGSAAAKSVDAADDDLGAIVSLAMMAAHKVVTAEAGPDHVTANAVLWGGAATAEDVAGAVAFLCSEGAGYMSGVTITVDGGSGSAVY